MRFPLLRRAGFSALSLLVLGLPAPALALTAAQVWEEMQQISERGGLRQRAAVATPGAGTLTLEGVTLISEEDAPRVTTLIDRLTLRELDTGGVEIVYPPQLRILLEDDSGVGIDRAELLLETTDLVTLASGAPGDMSFDTTTPAAVLRLSAFEDDGTAEVSEFTWTFTDLALSSAYGAEIADSAFSVAQMSGAVALSAPEDDSALRLQIALTDYAFSDRGSALLMSPTADTAALLTGQTPYSFESRHARLSLAVGGQIDGVAGGAALSTTGGGSAVSFADGQVSVASRAQGLDIQALVPSLASPLDAAAANMALQITLPATPTEDVRPIGLGLKLQELTVDEEVWAMFDPVGLLPRSPATLEVDLTGEGRASDDLLDPRAGARTMLDLDSLSINRLVLDAAGARITAEGGFDVDLSRGGTMPGLPALSGRIGMTSRGLNGLLDNLAELGLLRPSDVMGARMVIAMLTTPSNDPDTLSAEIELKPDGGLVANGMRLR